MGGYIADRVHRLKVVIIALFLVLGIGMLLLPFVGLVGTWVITVVVGFFLIFGFVAWTAAPGHYSDRMHPEDVATAEGLMLTLAAVGGFIVPIIFGHIEANSGFTWGWIFWGIVSLVFGVIGFAARKPYSASAVHKTPIAVERGYV